MESLRSLASLPLWATPFWAGRAAGRSLMGSLSPRLQRGEHLGRSRLPRRDAGGDPQAVVGGSRYGEPRVLGDSRADSGDTFEMPHGVLRKGSTPALHVTVHRAHREADR